MSRSKRFALSLISGYVQLAVNSLYILISVRLGLHYLSHDEYAMWMPVTVIAGYIALMDFGLSTAASRIIIDYKDHRDPKEYGGILQTTILVGLSQAALIAVAGIGAAFVMGPIEKIPAPLQHEFFWLVIGQCAVTAAMFGVRFVTLVLTAYQRYDITNYSSSLALVVNLTVLWLAFSHGHGVFSLVWAQAAGLAAAAAGNLHWCIRLKLFPEKGKWGKPTWAKFNELFVFGRDIFLFMAGQQLVSVSQTLLLTPLVGLDAALIWGVCTRGYTVLVQIIGRLFDFSSAPFAEMMVRGEHFQLLKRVREISILSVNMAAAAAALFAVGNGPFVNLWTKGEVHWAPINDLLIGIWLVVTITAKIHLGLVGISKNFRFLRYLIFLEGLSFIGLTVLLHNYGGITIMIAMSILCSLCFTVPYGLWRTRQYFNLTIRDMARWHRGTIALVLSVAPVAFGVWWLTRGIRPAPRLCIEMAILGPWTALMFLRMGLDPGLYAEILGKLPAGVRRLVLLARPSATPCNITPQRLAD